MCTVALGTRNIDSQELLLTSCHLKYTRTETKRNEESSNSSTTSYQFISVNLRNNLRVNLMAVYLEGLMIDALGRYNIHKSFHRTVSTQ